MFFAIPLAFDPILGKGYQLTIVNRVGQDHLLHPHSLIMIHTDLRWSWWLDPTLFSCTSFFPHWLVQTYIFIFIILFSGVKNRRLPPSQGVTKKKLHMMILSVNYHYVVTTLKRWTSPRSYDWLYITSNWNISSRKVGYFINQSFILTMLTCQHGTTYVKNILAISFFLQIMFHCINSSTFVL